MRKLSVYCDESGSTGSNFADLKQPFFVIAGWIVPSEKVDSLSDIIRSLAKGHGATELHSSTLLKSSKGCAVVVKLIESLKEQGCPPLFTIVEKRYAIAAKIVDTYLDYHNNPVAPPILRSSSLIASELTNTFCNIPEELLIRFAGAYRSLNKAELTQIAVELGGIDSSNIPRKALMAIPYMIPNIDKIIDAERELRNSAPNNTYGSLNILIFFNTLYFIEDIGEKAHAEASVYYDSTKSFEEGFKTAFALLKSTDYLKELEHERGEGVSIPKSLDHISQFTIAESHTTPLIQAADVLAGLLYQVATASFQHENIDQQLFQVARELFGLPLIAAFSDLFKGTGLLVSDAFYPNILSLLSTDTKQ